MKWEAVGIRNRTKGKIGECEGEMMERKGKVLVGFFAKIEMQESEMGS